MDDFRIDKVANGAQEERLAFELGELVRELARLGDGRPVVVCGGSTVNRSL